MENDKVQIIDTPEGITVFQLLAVKSAIKLEMLGMRHSGGSVKARWAKQFGLTSRTKPEVVIAAIQKRITEITSAPGFTTRRGV